MINACGRGSRKATKPFVAPGACYPCRIVEEVIERLLDDIAELVEDKAQKQFLKAVEEAKHTTVTEESALVVKASMLYITAYWVDGFTPAGFRQAMAAAVLISVVGSFLAKRVTDQAPEWRLW